MKIVIFAILRGKYIRAPRLRVYWLVALKLEQNWNASLPKCKNTGMEGKHKTPQNRAAEWRANFDAVCDTVWTLCATVREVMDTVLYVVFKGFILYAFVATVVKTWLG